MRAQAAVRSTLEGLSAIAAAADAVVAAIDAKELAAFYGLKAPSDESPGAGRGSRVEACMRCISSGLTCTCVAMHACMPP